MVNTGRPGISAISILLAAAAAFPAAAAQQAPRGRVETDKRLAEQATRIAELEAQVAQLRAAGPAEVKAIREQIEKLEEALAAQGETQRAARAADWRAEARDVNQLREEVQSRTVVGATKPGLKLSGYLQSDFTTRSDQADEIDFSTGEPLNQTRFLLRRARLRADVEAGPLGAALELDANTVRGAATRVVVAEASWKLLMPEDDKLPLLQLAAGLFKIPFGFELLQSDRDRLFVERSTAERALFPGEYDLGARAQGGWRFLRWNVAVMNGHPVGERGLPSRSPTAAKDVVGRAGVETELHGVKVRGGFSALWGNGFHRGSPATKDVLVWRDYNEDNQVQLSEILVIPGRPSTPSASFKHSALGLDLGGEWIWSLGALNLSGELYWAKNLDRGLYPGDPLGAGRDLRQLGAYLAAVQDVGTLFQVGARYDFYQPDRDASEVRGGGVVPLDPSFATFSLAAAVRAPGRGRLVLQYDRNSNALGRTATGSPTTLGRNAFTARAQVEW